MEITRIILDDVSGKLVKERINMSKIMTIDYPEFSMLSHNNPITTGHSIIPGD